MSIYVYTYKNRALGARSENDSVVKYEDAHVTAATVGGAACARGVELHHPMQRGTNNKLVPMSIYVLLGAGLTRLWVVGLFLSCVSACDLLSFDTYTDNALGGAICAHRGSGGKRGGAFQKHRIASHYEIGNK